MECDVKTETEPPHLLVTVRGQMDFEECRQLLNDITAEASAQAFPPMLFNLLELQATVSATDLFQLMAGVRDTQIGVKNRVAVVGQLRPPFDRLGYAVEIASRRGLQFQGFRDLDQAREWLGGGLVAGPA